MRVDVAVLLVSSGLIVGISSAMQTMLDTMLGLQGLGFSDAFAGRVNFTYQISAVAFGTFVGQLVTKPKSVVVVIKCMYVGMVLSCAGTTALYWLIESKGSFAGAEALLYAVSVMMGVTMMAAVPFLAVQLVERMRPMPENVITGVMVRDVRTSLLRTFTHHRRHQHSQMWGAMAVAATANQLCAELSPVATSLVTLGLVVSSVGLAALAPRLRPPPENTDKVPLLLLLSFYVRTCNARY
jgi:hypothetical protein